MKDKPAVPLLIGVLLGIAIAVGAGFYFFVFGYLSGSPVARTVIVLVTLALLGAVAAVVRQRVRELGEEETDDYRNY